MEQPCAIDQITAGAGGGACGRTSDQRTALEFQRERGPSNLFRISGEARERRSTPRIAINDDCSRYFDQWNYRFEWQLLPPGADGIAQSTTNHPLDSYRR